MRIINPYIQDIWIANPNGRKCIGITNAYTHTIGITNADERRIYRSLGNLEL